MSSSDILDVLDAPIRFTQRPVSLPPDFRPDFKLAILVLILVKCCRSAKSSLRKLHVLNWAIRNKESRENFIRLLEGSADPDQAIVRFEPALNRAIDFARGEGLVVRESGDRLVLSAKGGLLVEDIDQTEDCLVEERMFLSRVGKIAVNKIDRLLKMGA